MGKFTISYTLNFKDKKSFVYPIEIDDETLSYIPKESSEIPEWTKLKQDQCLKCSSAKDGPGYCSLLPNLHELVQSFSKVKSFEKVEVEVKTDERTFNKSTDVQTALTSIFGLIMAASDCPQTQFFRPIVRFHLPFATMEETLFRIVSMYLLSQYFKDKKQINFDDVLNDLKADYERVGKMNRVILDRIRQVVKEDADKNAFIGLELFVQSFTFEYDLKLDSLSYLFGKKITK